MNSNENIQVIEIPKWGLSMEEGTIVEWLIKEGDSFETGDLIAEIESSKIVNGLEAHFAGTLRQILAAAGETLPVGAVIGIAADQSVSDDALVDYIAALGVGAETVSPDEGAAGQVSEPNAQAIKSSRPESSGHAFTNDIPAELMTGSADSEVHATLHARRLARDLGINLHKVPGTGRNKRISRQDVLDAILRIGGSVAPEFLAPNARTRLPHATERGATVPAHLDERNGSSRFTLGNIGSSVATDVALSGMRRSIAERMARSKHESPHFRVVVDVEIDQLLSARKEKNNKQSNVRISVNDYLIKACARALVQVPACNVQFDGHTIRRFHDAHISVAVALDDGLISPIVKNANNKSLVEIADDLRVLIGKAEEGALAADEYQGGTFTISNLGTYGVKHFDAIVNPPQGAILAVGIGEQRPIVRDGKVIISTVMTLTLSSDHRVIDGVVAARFLGMIKEFLENPAVLES